MTAADPPRLGLCPDRDVLAEPLRRRLASYEVDRACAYAATPDLPRMQHRLTSACADLRPLADGAAQMDAARLRVLEALNERAVLAAQDGDAVQAQALVDEMVALSHACAAPTVAAALYAKAGAALMAEAHEGAFERAAEAARYNAEFGDACQLRAKLEEAALHPGPWSFTPDDQALLFAVCVRRLTEAETSLLARLPSKPFVESQLAAVEEMARALGLPVPESLRQVAQFMLMPPPLGVRAPDSACDLSNDGSGEIMPGEMVPGVEGGMPPLPVTQWKAPAGLNE